MDPADIEAIEKGLGAEKLANRKLWPGKQPPELTALWNKMKKYLLTQDDEWEVWTDWYDARMEGRPANQGLEIARVLIKDEIWQQGPKVVNARIKLLLGNLPNSETSQPLLEPGPALQVTAKGLELITQPIGDDFDQDLQRGLHSRLQRLLPTLTGITHKICNAYPELDLVISEYGDLIAEPFEKLDIASLWAVGAGVLAFREAFANQSNATMTAPLEPGQFALLQQAAEIHGGFILGFPKGRELTDRADQARLSPDIVAQISSPVRDILGELARANSFVEKHTREFLKSIEAGMIVRSWQTARAGHVGYLVTRNSLIALGRALLHANSVLATVTGSIITRRR